MLKAVQYVFRENRQNIYRIYSIAKYSVKADIRDSRLGIFWNFASPAIQIFTYWFMFGYVFQRKDVDGIPYLLWLIGGISVWFFISPCITEGCNAIFKRVDIITKMQFPVSILPLTVVLQKLFDHLCLMCITFSFMLAYGYYPSIHWLGLLYYLFCAVIFTTALSFITSVLNMLARDTKKFISATMRMLLYMTPVLWDIGRVEGRSIEYIIKCNPVYYIVQGYRDCFFYHEGFFAYTWSMGWFWGITIGAILIGSYMMYKFKTKFIDLV